MKKVGFVTLITCLLILCCSMGGFAAVTDYSDMPDKSHWSYDALSSAVDNGLLKGDENQKLNPGNYLTRAEMAAVIVRSFGADKAADLSDYSDVNEKDWYYQELAKAVGMNAFVGYSDGTIHPNALITRQEAFLVVSRVLMLDVSAEPDFSGFKDGNDVAKWAAPSLSALVKAGYVRGSQGNLYPQDNITRAEFAQIFYNVIKSYYGKPEQQIIEVPSGNILVKGEGSTVKAEKVTGDLLIGDGVQKDTVTIDGTEITGRLVLRNSGKSTVTLKNADVDEIIFGIGGEETVLKLDADTTVKNILVADGVKGTIVLDALDEDLKITMGKDSDISVYDGEGNTLTVIDGVAVNLMDGCSVAQAKKNYTAVDITLKDYRDLIAAGVTSCDVTAELILNETVVQSFTKSIDLNESGIVDIKSGMWKDQFDPGFYGNVSYTVSLKADEEVFSEKEMTVAVNADEYNFAPLTATFPVTYFTLSLWDITENEEGEPIPTFVNMGRPAQWNWNDLPENVYPVPGGRNYAFFETQKFMKAYIANILEANPEAKIHFWINDNSLTLYFECIVANNVDESQYNVVLLSDGTGSYTMAFKNSFNVADPQAQYDAMKDEWNRIKEKTAENGYLDYDDINYAPPSTPDVRLWGYAYVAVKESENFEWWVARKNITDTFSLTAPQDGGAFLDSFMACTKVKAVGLNTLLTALQAKGDDTVKAFKDLYNFNDEMFGEAEKTGKNVMMFLGTRVTGEKNFEASAEFVMDYYGDDEYVYYYKGHPGTPTELYPAKQEQLKDMGIIDVNSSIAAELILFFYPDLYMCGYQSSTFLSVSDAKMATALFNTTKAAGASLSYGDLVQMFISKVDLSNAYYSAYADLCAETDHEYFLVEFKDTTKHPFAIWDATAKTATYYANTGTEEAPVWTETEK